MKEWLVARSIDLYRCEYLVVASKPDGTDTSWWWGSAGSILDLDTAIRYALIHQGSVVKSPNKVRE